MKWQLSYASIINRQNLGMKDKGTMKKIIAGCLLAGLLCSCVKFTYTTVDGTKVSYFRTGKQSLEGVKANFSLPDGTKKEFEIGKQKGDSGNIAEAAKNVSEAALKLATKIP